MTFTGDELILALVSLVRATRPSMLKQEGDGFVVDFSALDGKTKHDLDDALLLKMRIVLEPPPGAPPPESADAPLLLELDLAERQRLESTLARLEGLQTWPADVVTMSRALRKRLTSAL